MPVVVRYVPVATSSENGTAMAPSIGTRAERRDTLEERGTLKSRWRGTNDGDEDRGLAEQLLCRQAETADDDVRQRTRGDVEENGVKA